MEESNINRNNTDECYNYLISLSSNKNICTFNLKHFEELFSRTQKLDKCRNTEVQGCCITLLLFLKETEKHYRLNCDIAYAFCLVVHSRVGNTRQLCDIILNIRESFPHDILTQTEESIHLLKKHSTILVAAILKLIVSSNYAFENTDEYFSFMTQLRKHIIVVLSKGGDIYALLCVCECLLNLAKRGNLTNVGTRVLEDIFGIVMCVVMKFWNYHISEIRSRAQRLSVTCLVLNYEDDLKNTKYRNSMTVIVNMKLFKSFANDMFWNVPYKYFAYLAGLEFYSHYGPVAKLMLYVQSDLQEGFRRSLQNKRVIGCETDLFRFCTQSLSLPEWTQIFQPVVDRVISSDSIVMANNFSRYWLPVILKKFPEYGEKIWSSLPHSTFGPCDRNVPQSRIVFALLKVAHRYCIRLPLNRTDKYFFSRLEDYFADSEETRGELFAFLCNLEEQSMVPTEDELRLILRFLQINVHSSSTKLRQQVFSSFTSFVIRILCSGLKTLRTDKQETIAIKLKPILTFLKNFSEFLIDGMQPGCSYQRKITSLTLYKIFMTYAVSNCGEDLRRNDLKHTIKFVTWIEEQDEWYFTNPIYFAALFRCLMDPCREIQNVSFILLRSYFDLKTMETRVSVFNDVLILIRNYQFYKRQCGVWAMISLICLAYNTGPEHVIELGKEHGPKFSTFTEMFLQILQEQIGFLNNDVFSSAVYAPLDATIKILTYLVADVRSPEYNLIAESEVELLIKLLEDTVPILLKALFVNDFGDYAPSFEETDNALQQIIRTSGISRRNLRDSGEQEFQLNPTYQILSNFIWISLKACCECESKLVVNKKDLNQTLVIRCCDLIVKKLKLCRHKGVIEAAGIALSSVVDALTARNICEHWLDTTLTDVVSLIETKSNATISRKSAGLSLLIQNIVGNDSRIEKPLLKKCWQEFRRILDVNYADIDIDLCFEMPQTHALHFLRVLTADARNSANLVPYFEDITLHCLQALEAPSWIIRNASFQLFGAILPQIVGQKNSQNDFGVRRCFEEVFSCMPRLLDYIVVSVQRANRADSSRLILHSNLVPLLVLLSNVQIGSVSLLEKSFLSKFLLLREHLKSLLGSELYYVRKLAGKAFIALHSRQEMTILEKIREEIVQQVLMPEKNENLLHGLLFTLKQAFVLHLDVPNFQKTVPSILVYPFRHLTNQKISLMSDSLLIDLGIRYSRQLFHVTITDLKSILRTLYVEKHVSMGYEEWIQVLLRRIVITCDYIIIEKLMEDCLNDSDSVIVENALKAFNIRIIPNDMMDRIFIILCNCMERYLVFSNRSALEISILNLIFEALILIPLRKFYLVEKGFCERNYRFLKQLNLYEFQAMNLRILSLFLPGSHSVWVNEILIELHSVLDANRFNNRDMRLNAAQGIKLLYGKLKCDVNLNTTWQIMIDMLLDEEVDIQNVGCQFIKTFNEDIFYSPKDILMKMFHPNFLYLFLRTEIIIDTLLEHISPSDKNRCTNTIKYLNEDIVNPFNQDTSNHNSDREDIEILNCCGKAMRCFINRPSYLKYFYESVNLSGYLTDLDKMRLICHGVIENEFLVTAQEYTLALRYYYLLSIAAEFLKYKQGIKSYHSLSFEMVIDQSLSLEKIVESCERFQKTFHLNNVICETYNI